MMFGRLSTHCGGTGGVSRRFKRELWALCGFTFGVLLLFPMSPSNTAKAVRTLPDESNPPDLIRAFVSRYELRQSMPVFRRETLADQLDSPDGLAVDPYTGSIYVSEEVRGRIIRIDLDGSRQVVVDTLTRVVEETERGLVSRPGLRMPEGVAVDHHGGLYVVEDRPGGRLIRYGMVTHPDGRRSWQGTVVPMPEPAPGYAWESISVGPNGELLLAGSNMEAFLANRSIAGHYSGAILYRDEEGEWWMPVHRPLESYSSACFDPDGHYAFFTSEMLGDVGCIDLATRRQRIWYAETHIDQPEGVTSLPDGTALVASEGGKIYRVDPADNRVTEIYDIGCDIESLFWEGARSRLLVTADGSSELVALATDLSFSDTKEIRGPMIMEPTTFVPVIPEVCPDYLAGILKRTGFDPFSLRPEEEVTFQTFAKNVSLFAIDAEARLLPSSDAIDDPVENVQFMILTPKLFGVDLTGLVTPISGFAAAKSSGDIDRTLLYPRRVTHVDLLDGSFTLFEQQKVALPSPLAPRYTPEGTASVSFMGFGECPDYHVIINLQDPRHAYMVAMHLDGTYQEYRLTLPEGRNVNQWIVGLEPTMPEMWARLQSDE